MEIYELQRLIDETACKAAMMGASRALQAAGVARPYMWKNEAYRMYGRANVDRWIAKGLVHPVQESGSERSRISVDELIRVALSDPKTEKKGDKIWKRRG